MSIALLSRLVDPLVGAQLAARLSLPLITDATAADFRFVLELSDSGLALCQQGARAPNPIRCDFVDGPLRHRRLHGGGSSQAIAKAVGIRAHRDLFVADLTAGLGGDGFALASLGARVLLFERNPIVAALLADGLARARRHGPIEPALALILGRLEHRSGDSRRWLEALTEAGRPDVIYLDPMFPERTKTAKVRKEMAAFHEIVGADADAAELLPLALAQARYRVVVKRARQAPPLGGRAPGYSLDGKTTRFDVYPLHKMPLQKPLQKMRR